VPTMVLRGRSIDLAAGRRRSTIDHYAGGLSDTTLGQVAAVGGHHGHLTLVGRGWGVEEPTRGSRSGPPLVMKTQCQTPRPIYQNDRKGVL
jgi:hypothetical protein